MELQSVDNDNHNRASGILSQDVLYSCTSSEVLSFFLFEQSVFILLPFKQ